MHLIETGHFKVNADGNPDLGSYGVLAGTVESFDTQILLDPLEEQFDLPTAFVDGCNGQCGQVEVVGEENQTFICQWIHKADTTQMSWKITFGLICVQADNLVTPQSGGLVDWTGLAYVKTRITFYSDNKESSCLVDGVKTSKINVSTIEYIDTPGFETNLVEEVHVMHGTVRNADGNIERHRSMVDASTA